MAQKQRNSISHAIVKQVGKALPKTERQIKRFLAGLEKKWEVDLDWKKERLVVHDSPLLEAAGTSVSMKKFTKCMNARIFTKLDLVLLLRRSQIRVTLVNHDKSPVEVRAIMEAVNTLALVRLL